MLLDGLDANAHASGDFGIREPLMDVLGDLSLAVRERRRLRV